MRLFLDGIAGISFVFQNNGYNHLMAVFRAHLSFYFLLPKNLIKRFHINQRFNHKGKFSFSILVKYYFAHCKKFKDL
jgi:hypothetical protein